MSTAKIKAAAKPSSKGRCFDQISLGGSLRVEPSRLPFVMMQLPFHQHTGEALLTHSLVNDDGNRIG